MIPSSQRSRRLCAQGSPKAGCGSNTTRECRGIINGASKSKVYCRISRTEGFRMSIESATPQNYDERRISRIYDTSHFFVRYLDTTNLFIGALGSASGVSFLKLANRQQAGLKSAIFSLQSFSGPSIDLRSSLSPTVPALAQTHGDIHFRYLPLSTNLNLWHLSSWQICAFPPPLSSESLQKLTNRSSASSSWYIIRLQTSNPVLRLSVRFNE